MCHWHPTVLPGWARCQNDALGGLLVSAVPFRPTGTQAGSVTVPFCDFKVIQTHPLEILGAQAAVYDGSWAEWGGASGGDVVTGDA